MRILLCIFEKDRIVLCYYKSPKSSAGLECSIPYEDIEKVEFSVVRTPIRHWLNKTYNYALDINIYTSEKLDNQMFRLETRAFKILMLLKDKIDSENIKICDKLEVINKYAGKEYEYIQLDLDKCYDTLIKEYSLEKLRTTDLIK